jgi:hypothetical protein
MIAELREVVYPPEAAVVKLYSRNYAERTPLDFVAPQHSLIDALLLRWGAWARVKIIRRGLASVESTYRRISDETPAATAALAIDADVVALERALVTAREPHRKTLVRFYVYRLAPVSICSLMHLRYEAWVPWIFACRAAAAYCLRRYDAAAA